MAKKQAAKKKKTSVKGPGKRKPRAIAKKSVKNAPAKRKPAKKMAAKGRVPHPEKAPAPLGVWPGKHEEHVGVREVPCANPVKPAYWALPRWEDHAILEKETGEEGIGCLSFFAYGCRNFDAAHDLISANYKEGPFTDDRNQKLMLGSNRIFYGDIRRQSVSDFLPGAFGSNRMKYAMVLAKDSKGNALGSTDGFLFSSGGKNSVIILHSSLSEKVMKRKYFHQLLYCALVSALLGSAEKMKLDYVMLTTEYPRLENQEKVKQTLGRLMFLGRGLGMSALPLVQCREPWGRHMPQMLAVRRIERADEPVATASEMLEIAGTYYAMLANAGIVTKEVASEAFGQAVGELKKKGKDEKIPLIPFPHSPDIREQARELGDMMEALGTLDSRCTGAYRDNPFCLEYLAILEKNNEIVLTQKQAVEIMRDECASKRNDLTPKTL
ncbi:MAG: hypothetical protein ABII71_02255 [Candidatus Micrarchaeota archaeon]